MTNNHKRLRRSQRYGPPPVNRKKGNPGNREKICALINFPEYVLQYTFIRVEINRYRLAVIHQGTVRTNECFPTLEAAKNAFADKYNGKSWKKDAVPEWTDLYEPNRQWLTDKLEFLRNSTSSQHNFKRRKHPRKRQQEAPIYA
jgi:hypothetical protein